MSETTTTAGKYTGNLLVAGGAGGGFIGWLTENATAISLGVTFFSFLVGGLFLYLNYKQNKRHKDEILRHNLVMESIALKESGYK